MATNHCRVCEGTTELNEDKLCCGCSADADRAESLGMGVNEYRHAVYEGGSSPQLSHTYLFAKWAFRTYEHTLQFRDVATKAYATIFGLSLCGYPDPDTYENMDCTGFEVGEGAFTTYLPTERNKFYVVEWRTNRGHFSEMTRESLKPEMNSGHRTQMLFTPLTLDDLYDGLDLEELGYMDRVNAAFDPETGREDRDGAPFEWGSR